LQTFTSLIFLEIQIVSAKDKTYFPAFPNPSSCCFSGYSHYFLRFFNAEGPHELTLGKKCHIFCHTSQTAKPGGEINPAWFPILSMLYPRRQYSKPRHGGIL